MPAARTPKGRAPHRRNEEARLRVLHAADDLLAERGFSGVSVEGIAARAGVAKQTIYRWWPSKVDILLDTLIDDAGRKLVVPEPDEGTPTERVSRYLRAFVKFLTRDDAGKVLLALLGEAQHDAETARVFHERYLEPRRAAERTMLPDHAKADADAALDALLGPIVYRAMTGAKIPPKFVDGLVAATLG
jgi:AcrR family transcriptional regulator